MKTTKLAKDTPCGETARGFEIIRFTDIHHRRCTIQQSSLIGNYPDAAERPGTSAIWLGVGSGDDRIHLSREDVAALVHILTSWLVSGSMKR